MQVKLDVSFPSGAKVELSKGQMDQVTKFVQSILFAEPNKEKRTYVKRRKNKTYKAWTDAEINQLNEIANLSTSEQRVKAMKVFAAETGRTHAAVYSQMDRIKTTKETPSPVFFH